MIGVSKHWVKKSPNFWAFSPIGKDLLGKLNHIYEGISRVNNTSLSFFKGHYG